MKRRISGNVCSICVLMSMMILLLAFSSSPAQALCAAFPFEGVWVNTAPQPVRISSATFEWVCQDQIQNGEPYPPGPPYMVNITGKSPIDGHVGWWGTTSNVSRFHGYYPEELVATFGAADSNGNYATTVVSFRPKTETYSDNGVLRSKKLLLVTAQTILSKYDPTTGEIINNPQTIGDKTEEVLQKFEKEWDVTIYECDGTVAGTRHVTADPNIADQDGDGLTNLEEGQGWHVSYTTSTGTVAYDVKSDPNSADHDGDGKTDAQEKAAGTDPNRRNTDCDGAYDTNDGFEIDNGMNPLNFDTDGDGASDGLEIDGWLAAGFSVSDAIQATKDQNSVPPPIAQVQITDFVGTWLNVDPNTSGIPKIEIGSDGNDLVIHGYGACTPTYCDWGNVTVPFNGNPVTAVYTFSFLVDTLTMTLLPDGRLHVNSKNVFTDGSNRDYVADYYFTKAQVQITDFVGTWLNVAPNTSGIPVLVTINVTPLTITLSSGSTNTFTAKGFDQDNNEINISRQVNWTVSNPAVGAIIPINITSGMFTALAAGTSTITATSANVTGTATVNVVLADEPLFNRYTPQLCCG